MKAVNGLTIFLHLFIGAGAVFGGVGAILDPHSPLGMPIEVLEHSPFGSFFLPGLFLFLVIGLGNIFAFAAGRIFGELKGYASGAVGVILCAWIIIQCIFLRSVVSLHIIFFFLGLIQGVLALYILFKNRQFPYYDVVYFFQRQRQHPPGR